MAAETAYQNDVQEFVVEIVPSYMPKLIERIKRFNRRIKRLKLKLSPLEIVKVEEPKIQETDVSGGYIPVQGYPYPIQGQEKRRVKVVEVTVKAPETLVLPGGWRLIAVLTRESVLSTGKAQVHTVSGQDGDRVEDKWLNIPEDNVCDHCGKARDRRKYFLVRRGTGKKCETKRVGSSCVLDFVGVNPSWCIRAMDLTGEIQREFGGGGVRMPSESLPVQRVLEDTCQMVYEAGGNYISRRTADFMSLEQNCPVPSTKDQVLEYMEAYTHKDPLKRVKRVINEDAIRMVEHIERFITTDFADKIDELDVSDFVRNALNFYETGVVPASQLGYIVGIVGFYLAEQARKAALNAVEERKDAPQLYYGEPKRRYKDVKVRALGHHTFDGMYGSGYVLKFEVMDEDFKHAKLTWITTSNPDWQDYWDLVDTAGQQGKHVLEMDPLYMTIHFSVKQHNEHDKYGKETRVTRVKRVG